MIFRHQGIAGQIVLEFVDKPYTLLEVNPQMAKKQGVYPQLAISLFLSQVLYMVYFCIG